jgi:hypothetical protein
MPGKTNPDRAKAAKKRIEENKSLEGRRWFKAEPDTETQLRILPPWADDLDWPFFETKTHRLNDRTYFLCPKGNDHETFCFACDVAIPALYKGTDADQAKAYSIRATNRIFCNVLERGNDAIGAQIWGLSMTMYDELVGYFSDPDYRDITDVNAGHDIVLKRKGSTKDDTKYSQRAKPKKTPVDNDNVLKTMFNLTEACGGAPTEEQKRMFKEALGLTFDDADIPETEPEKEEEEAEAFDFGPEADPKAKTKVEEPEEPEDTDDDAGELVPIEVPGKLKGKMKDIFLKKAQKESTCFGKLFDEDADECVASCGAVIECMAAFTSD